MTARRGPAVGADQINARWYPGRVVAFPEQGVDVTVIENRIYATDCGAWVRLPNGEVGIVHWSRLELKETTPCAG